MKASSGVPKATQAIAQPGSAVACVMGRSLATCLQAQPGVSLQTASGEAYCWRWTYSSVGLLWDPPRVTGLTSELSLTPKSSSALGEPLLDEGGQSDLDLKTLARWNPLTRRYLKVQDAFSTDSGTASYQSLLVVSDVPDGGMVFPGSEFIGRIDESGLDVDWAVRLHVRAPAQVASQNHRALTNLNEQYGQRGAEISHGLNMLDRVAEDLAEYVGILESDKLEVEAQATTIFCVAGPDQDSASTQARALTDFLADTGLFSRGQPANGAPT
jgi:hypothetical protein